MVASATARPRGRIMNLDRAKFLSVFKTKLVASLFSHFHWLTKARTNFRGEAAQGYALVLVLGREHYEERQARYPVRRRSDLARVLKLELPRNRETLVHIGPFADDHRTVTFFELKSSVTSLINRALFIVPESLLLSASLDERAVLTVSRDSLSYFVSRTTASQLAGGLVKNVGLYAMAAGIPLDQQSVLSNDADCRVRFAQGIKSIEFGSWLGFLAPSVRASVRDQWQPALMVFSGLLAVYLVLASAYLHGLSLWREHQLAGLGAEVGELAETQRRIDRVVAEHEALARLANGRWETYRAWEVAGQIWNLGGSFTVINMIGPKITVRGSTGDATELLKRISMMPIVDAAKFVAPVRQESTGQEFMIEVLLKSEHKRG